ncbi:hypothetical protein L5F09_02690 [Aliarcobacter butzleri]|uniref:hypothetical protein n=1 Tax=Aliarcobacter butzleri TaxID=28197 RepID=UPI001EDA7B8F|nr:hypothetical protein [Aliarcobacter butzleri]MCG3664649.1 hypothetical protein [Aliarcobacter butzleri]
MIRSRYNNKKILVICEIKECDNVADHTHHILEQHKADKNGFIGHIRVNHKANLVGLCESCHNKVHRNEIIIKGYVQTSKGLELDYQVNKK